MKEPGPTPPMHSAELRAWQWQEVQGLPLVAACLDLWSCRDFTEQWGPVSGLVSWARASVVNRGWADTDLLLDKLVDRCQLAPITALTMYPSEAMEPWPGTIPTAYLVSGMISPHHWGPLSEGLVWRSVFGSFIVCTSKSVRLSLTRSWSQPLLLALVFLPST